MSKIKNNLDKYIKKNRFILISLVLFCVGAFFIIFHVINHDSFTVLIQPLQNKNINAPSNNILLTGDKIVAEFRSEYNNLGIISFRFNAPNQITNDIIIFRIIDQSNHKIIYSNKYDARQFVGLPFYPFGFPPIENSKWKIYRFEIQSLAGSRTNAIGISTIKPLSIASYQFPTKILLHNRSSLIKFAQAKVINEIRYVNLIYIAIVAFLPLILYLASSWLLSKLIKSEKNKYVSKLLESILTPILVILFIVILIDIFIIKTNYDGVLIIVGGLFITLMKPLRFTSGFFYITGILFICLSAIIYNLNLISSAEISSVWAFTFFVLGLGKNLNENYLAIRKGIKVK